ncbi:MAG: hypothetical protein K2N88_03270 [Muribaculaceae bacterium]|nr:hypothetical protein [Muribaculaceae bacterium]
MNKIFLLAASLMMLLTTLTASAQDFDKLKEAKRIESELKTATTPTDSLRILYNALDLSPKSERIRIGEKIYDICVRIGRPGPALDVLRIMSQCRRDSAFMANLQKKALALPQSQERDETRLFLTMDQLVQNSRYEDEATRQKRIIDLLAIADDLPVAHSPLQNEDIADYSPQHAKLLALYTLVNYLSNDASGDMLKTYVDKLYNEINKPYIKLYAIKNSVYAGVANIYSDAGDHRKAVEADRKLLRVVDELEKHYASKGREYRNYDVSRYIIYRRMLRNYKGLTPAEIDDLYQKSLELAKRDPEVASDMRKEPRFYAYYYIAKGDYNSAKPKIKELLNSEKISSQTRKQLLENLISAAEHTGDSATKMAALSEYNSLLEELNRTQATNKYKELQIKYDVAELKSRNAELEIENRDEELNSARRMMTFVTAAFVLVLIIVVLALYHWTKFVRNAATMGHIVDSIHQERCLVHDAVYYDYAQEFDPMLSSDRAKPLPWKKRLKKYGHKDISVFMTESIINDLLYIASFGRRARRKYVQHCSIDSTLRQIEGRVRHLADDFGIYEYEFPDDDFSFETDQECISLIIAHLLIEGAKLSPSDRVSLTARRTPDRRIDFVITIHDIQSKTIDDPHIMADFVEYNNILTHPESGLLICRLISMLIKANHYPDPTYKKAARYIFSVPENMNI